MLILGLTRAVRIEPFTAFRTLPSNLSSTRLIPEVAISYRVETNSSKSKHIIIALQLCLYILYEWIIITTAVTLDAAAQTQKLIQMT